VKRIEPEFASTPRADPRADGRAFIFLGFKTLDTGFNSVLESTWRDWTGARAIYLGLHPEFDLARYYSYSWKGQEKEQMNDISIFNSRVLNSLDFLEMSEATPTQSFFRRIVFYRRVSPLNDLDLFTYVVMAEVWNVVPANLIRALDFVQVAISKCRNMP